MASEPDEYQHFTALQAVLSAAFGASFRPRTKSELEDRKSALAQLIDGEPAVGLASWSLFAQDWAAHSLRNFAPGLDPVDPLDSDKLTMVSEMSPFAGSLGALLKGDTVDPATMVPIATDGSGAVAVVNPSRQGRGDSKVVFVDWGGPFFLRSRPVSRDIDHIDERERLPTLIEFIGAITSGHLEPRFAITASGHRIVANEDEAEDFHREFPWPVSDH